MEQNKSSSITITRAQAMHRQTTAAFDAVENELKLVGVLMPENLKSKASTLLESVRSLRREYLNLKYSE